MTDYQTKELIRNANGSLVCDVVYDNGVWTVTVKRKGIYTFITLYGDGDIRVENIGVTDSAHEAEYSVAIPE